MRRPIAVRRLPAKWRITGVGFTCLYRSVPRVEGSTDLVDAREPWDAVACPGTAEVVRRSWS